MRIGLDFDNTLIRYDEVFCRAAIERGLLPAGFTGSKQDVRDAIRLITNGELKWQALQGYVYGKGIGGAVPFPGVEDFLKSARERGDTLIVVSHKTEFGHFDPDKVNLRQAALGWMTGQRFFDADGFGMSTSDVHFAATRAEKLARIGAVDVDVFIDDLEEVLGDPDFPSGVRRILFAEGGNHDGAPYEVISDWQAIRKTVLA